MNENKCVQVEEMQGLNCLIYSETNGIKQCHLCDEDYYMDSQSNCVYDDAKVVKDQVMKSDKSLRAIIL